MWVPASCGIKVDMFDPGVNHQLLSDGTIRIQNNMQQTNVHTWGPDPIAVLFHNKTAGARTSISVSELF